MRSESLPRRPLRASTRLNHGAHRKTTPHFSAMGPGPPARAESSGAGAVQRSPNHSLLCERKLDFETNGLGQGRLCRRRRASSSAAELPWPALHCAEVSAADRSDEGPRAKAGLNPSLFIVRRSRGSDQRLEPGSHRRGDAERPFEDSYDRRVLSRLVSTPATVGWAHPACRPVAIGRRDSRHRSRASGWRQSRRSAGLRRRRT